MQFLRDELRAVPSIVGHAPDFDVNSAPDSPRVLFLRWLRYAMDAGVQEAHAATLSTVDEDGFPDARVLIVKDVTDDCGFSFGTGTESAKGQQLLHNPHCALTFYWSPLARAVRIRGIAQRASAEESAKDFLARHPRARAIALAGQQSSIIQDVTVENELIAQAEAAIKLDGTIVSAYWAAWTIVPNAVEFWQGDPTRHHRRLRYVRTADSWDKQRLWP